MTLLKGKSGELLTKDWLAASPLIDFTSVAKINKLGIMAIPSFVLDSRFDDLFIKFLSKMHILAFCVEADFTYYYAYSDELFRETNVNDPIPLYSLSMRPDVPLQSQYDKLTSCHIDGIHLIEEPHLSPTISVIELVSVLTSQTD